MSLKGSKPSPDCFSRLCWTGYREPASVSNHLSSALHQLPWGLLCAEQAVVEPIGHELADPEDPREEHWEALLERVVVHVVKEFMRCRFGFHDEGHAEVVLVGKARLDETGVHDLHAYR